MITIREYIDPEGRSFYAKWFNRLNAIAAARVITALVAQSRRGREPQSAGDGLKPLRNTPRRSANRTHPKPFMRFPGGAKFNNPDSHLISPLIMISCWVSNSTENKRSPHL